MKCCHVYYSNSCHMCALHTYTYIHTHTLSALVLCTLCFSNSEKWSCKKLWNKIYGFSSLSLIFLSQWFQTVQGNIHSSFSQQLYEANYTKLGFTHYAKSHFVQPQKNMFVQGLATSYCLEITPSCSGIYLVWLAHCMKPTWEKVWVKFLWGCRTNWNSIPPGLHLYNP